MSFDEKWRMKKELGKAREAKTDLLDDLRFGRGTRLFDAISYAVDQLGKARYPRRALFVISDGANTRGSSTLSDAVRKAVQNKVLVYSLLMEKGGSDLETLRTLSEQTGGTYFVLFQDFPRLHAAYEKISRDLAHRFTLYYRSTSDYKKRTPKIKIRMKNPQWRVRYQKMFIPVKEEIYVGRNHQID